MSTFQLPALETGAFTYSYGAGSHCVHLESSNRVPWPEGQPGLHDLTTAPSRSTSSVRTDHSLPDSAAMPATAGASAVTPGTTSARTAGPAPDTTAGTPALRNAATSSAVAGIELARYGWCRKSSVASSSSPASGTGRVSAATRRAERAAFRAASACG